MWSSIKSKIRHDKKGSLVVEAAVFLPVFIVGMLTIGYLVKFCAINENVFHSFADETGKIAANAAISDVPPVFYENDVKKRATNENPGEITGINVTDFYYQMPSLKGDELIKATLNYDIKVALPIRFIKDIPASDTIITRAFVGDEQEVAPMPFSEMEESLGSATVWVFPVAGTKYHGEFCSYIVNDPKERMLTIAVRNEYSPCKLCDPGSLGYGNLVYCFSTGNVYHLGECATVTKYVTAIEEKEAINRGYTPCSRCGGQG